MAERLKTAGMALPPGRRKLTLAVHLSVSVGWIGAVTAYAALDVAATTSQDAQIVRAAYLGMRSIAFNVIVPLALASLLTGLIVSLGTRWGLFRHWWVFISFLLTVFAALVLLVETRTIGALATMASDPTTSGDQLRALGGTLLHSIGGTVVLLVVLVLNVFKPRGLTPYGWRKQQEERRAFEGRRQADEGSDRMP